MLAYWPVLLPLVFGLLAWQAAGSARAGPMRFRLKLGLSLLGTGFPLLLLTACARLLARTDCVSDSHFGRCEQSSEFWGALLFMGFRSGAESLYPSLLIGVPLALFAFTRHMYLTITN